MFAVWHATSVERYLGRVTNTRFAEQELGVPLQQVPLAVAADGQVWVRHALSLVESGDARLRWTDIDNAPMGRPVFWNSAWAQWLVVCGKVRMAFTGEPLAHAIEGASLWANLPILLLVMTLASGWVWRRWGGAAGALTAVAMVGHRKFYEGFYAGYADHHGLINASVLGVVLGVTFAGGGWWRREAGGGRSLMPCSEREVFRAATISAVCGALGMWVSAASLAVTIGVTGAAALAVGLLRGASRDEAIVCVPGAWRRWGRVGGALSLLFYLLENAPDRIAFRLEANHPLYSLAWWGAGEGIAAALLWRTSGRPFKWLLPRLLGWGAAVLTAPAAVGLGGERLFAPLNPFLSRIHESIHEFEPFGSVITRGGWRPYGDQLLILILSVVLVVIWAVRRTPGQERLMVGFLGAVALAATALGWYQSRWMLTASGSQIVLMLFLVTALGARLQVGARVTVTMLAAVMFCLAGPWMLVKERRLVERARDVQMGETMQLLYRDVAAALLKDGADGSSVVLASPNTSVGVGYYGRLRTLGTLYWENGDGLRMAAEIFGARDDSAAAARILMQGITHVAMISSYDFLDEYDYALRGARAPSDEAESFGRKLLYRHRVPVWLRPIDYAVPAPLRGLNLKVALFAVDFETSAPVAHERIAVYQLRSGELVLAEASLMASLTADPTRPSPWFIQGQLLLSAGREREAFNFIRAGVERAPNEHRARLVEAAAEAFARRGAEGQALARALWETLNGASPAVD